MGLSPKSLEELLEYKARLDKANTPFEDADKRIEIYQPRGTWYNYRLPGCECGPYDTWREAYRAAEAHLYLSLHKN